MNFEKILGVGFYLAVLLLAVFLVRLGEKRKWKVLIVLGLLVPVVLAGLRGATVGTDTAAYYKMYQQTTTEGWQKTFDERIFNREIEPFIVFWTKLGGFLGAGVWWTFGAFALITVGFMYLAIRLIERKESWLLFGAFLLMAFPSSLNIMRQMAAMSVLTYLLVVVYRWVFFGKGKMSLWKLGALGAFAVCLHYASLVILPVLIVPFLYKRLGIRKVLVGLVVLFWVALPILMNFRNWATELGVLSEKHIGGMAEFQESFTNYNFVILAFVGGLLAVGLVKSKVKKMASEEVRKYEVRLLITLVGAVYATSGFFSGYIARVADFFWPVAIYFVWREIDRYIPSARMKYGLMIGGAVGYFVMAYGVLGTNDILNYF